MIAITQVRNNTCIERRIAVLKMHSFRRFVLRSLIRFGFDITRQVNMKKLSDE